MFIRVVQRQELQHAACAHSGAVLNKCCVDNKYTSALPQSYKLLVLTLEHADWLRVAAVAVVISTLACQR
jgi:hypothetical protein